MLRNCKFSYFHHLFTKNRQLQRQSSSFCYTSKMPRTLPINLLLLLFYLLTSPAASGRACNEIFHLQIAYEFPKELTLMSYNVENLAQAVGGFERNEQKQLQPIVHRAPFPKPLNKSKLVRDILNEVRPDILVLTEVESLAALKSTAGSLREAYKPFMVEGNDMRNINISFLVKKDLEFEVVLESHRNMKWRDPVDNKVDKLFTRDAPTLLLHKAGETTPFLIVIGVHAKSKRDRYGDPESFLWRKAEFNGFVSIIKTYQRRFGAKVPIVLAGDFNTDVLRSPEMQVLRAELSSAFDSAILATAPKDRITHTYHPSSRPAVLQQLDDIQISPSLRNSILEARVYRYKTEDGRTIPFPLSILERNQLPSDHWPVYIRLSTEGF